MADIKTLLADPAQLSDWVKRLPAKDSTETARVLLGTLAAMPKAELAPDAALAALDTLRPRVHATVKALMAPYVNEGAALEGDQEKAANTALQLVSALPTLYGNALTQARQAGQDETVLGPLLHRTLADQIAQQQLHYQLYLAIPDRLWLRLHKRFLLANQLKLAGFVSEDPVLTPKGAQPVQRLYAVALLLACSGVNRLTPSSIQAVTALLLASAGDIALTRQPVSDAERTFVVDLASGSAPSLAALASFEEGAVPCYLRIDKLLKRLELLLENATGSEVPGPAGMVSAHLLRHLQTAWGEYIHREAREPADTTVQVARGLTHVHYYLGGAQDIYAFVGRSGIKLSIAYEEHEDVATIEAQRSGDVWSRFLIEDVKNLVEGPVPDSFRFQQRFEASGEPDTDTHPLATVRQVDRSAHGCGLCWPADAAVGLQVEELLAWRENGGWVVGEVAWQNRQDEEVRSGVKLLSRQPIPLAVERPLGMQAEEDWLPVLLLPQENGFRDSSVVMLPTRTFREGDLLTVCQRGISHKIKLTDTLRRTRDVTLFGCGFVLDE